MLAAAAVGVLGVAAVGGATAVAGGSYGLYRKRKNKKETKLRHRQMLDSMKDQWDGGRTNDNVDELLYPNPIAEIDYEGKQQLNQDTVSIGMGWDDETTIQNLDDVMLFAAVFDDKGKCCGAVSPNKRDLGVVGVTHTGVTLNPQTGRTYSGYPDKQNIIVSFPELAPTVYHIVVGSLLFSDVALIDSYLALFNGTDVPAGQENSVISRIFLDASECGVCNGYIMGTISKKDGAWAYYPVRAAVASKTANDLVYRMQRLIVPNLELPLTTRVNFRCTESVTSIWYGYDRFGYLRFTKEIVFPNNSLTLSDVSNSDGITKIICFVNRVFNPEDRFIVTTDDETHEFELLSCPQQMIATFYAHDPSCNIPFPVNTYDDQMIAIVRPTRIQCEVLSTVNIQKEIEAKFSPFTANCVLVSLIEGKNLTPAPSKKSGKDKKDEVLLSPRDQQRDAKKLEKLTPEVTVSLNGNKIKSTAIKSVNPEWNETFELPLKHDWLMKESTVVFTVTDKSTKKPIGTCAYALKMLQIPFLGTLKLDNDIGSLGLAINVIEKAIAPETPTGTPRSTPIRESRS